MGILKQKDKTKSKTLSVRINGDLHTELEKLREEAEAVGCVFDVAEVVEKALANAARTVRAELDSLPKSTAAKEPEKANAAAIAVAA